MCSFLGGPSSQEESQAAQTSSLASSLTANYQQRFSQQQDTLKQLQSEITQIQSGNTGPGFGAAELAAKTAQIQNSAAASTKNAQQAAQDEGSGQTFGNDSSGLQSGIRKQINGQIASGSETQESNALENLTTQNYAQGRTNAAATASGLATLSGQENPLGFAGDASGTDQAAFNQQNTINSQQVTALSVLGGLTGDALNIAKIFKPGK